MSVGLGVFDGVHLGHQQLAAHCDRLLTFDPHPRTALGIGDPVPRLTTLEEMAVFAPGIAAIPFDRDLANLSPDAFLDTVILPRFSPHRIVVGYDFCFGKNRAGNGVFLKAWGEKKGIEVLEIPAFSIGDTVVKSNVIRQYLLAGRFEDAIAFLGHPYLMIGDVVSGEGRGKTLGYPTANLRFSPEKLLPKPGVYCGRIDRSDIPEIAMVYIGRKPTFDGQTVGVEVHLLAERRLDLYGEQLPVLLTHRLRDDCRFESTAALQAQIAQDIHTAQSLLPTL